MPVRRIEDIEKEKHNEKREKLVRDINYVVDNVFKKPKKENKSLIWFMVKILVGLTLLMISVNLILGNIWLLKFFWGQFF